MKGKASGEMQPRVRVPTSRLTSKTKPNYVHTSRAWNILFSNTGFIRRNQHYCQGLGYNICFSAVINLKRCFVCVCVCVNE